MPIQKRIKIKMLTYLSGKTSRAVAKELGIGETDMSNYICGRVDWPESRLRALAQVLGVTYDEILEADRETVTCEGNRYQRPMGVGRMATESKE